MIRSIKPLIATFLFLFAGAAMAELPAYTEGQAPQPPLSAGSYAYQLFLPRGYLSSDDARWPLLIFLHGAGERGSDLDLVKLHGPPKIVGDRPGFPFVTVSPQLPADEENWDAAILDAMLDLFVERLRVDPDRIYLTGLSRGGYGVFDWATARPERFAAIAAVCGGGDIAAASRLKDLPVWAFHGDGDDVVPLSESIDMVTAIRACGGDPRLTVYPATGHDSWTPTYEDPALYQWLLEQRRSPLSIEPKQSK